MKPSHSLKPVQTRVKRSNKPTDKECCVQNFLSFNLTRNSLPRCDQTFFLSIIPTSFVALVKKFKSTSSLLSISLQRLKNLVQFSFVLNKNKFCCLSNIHSVRNSNSSQLKRRRDRDKTKINQDQSKICDKTSPSSF